jgi:hypothetical protein
VYLQVHRRDGRHLTDRRRIIPDTVNMKSRKHYPAVLVGFVNVNANKAKCSLVTASRILTLYVQADVSSRKM